jgi:hypothetical protein
VLVLLHRAETGNALLAALKSERTERPAYTWDPRIYGIGAQILRELGVGRMRLMSSPRKMPSMAGFGLEITGYFTPGSEYKDYAYDDINEFEPDLKGAGMRIGIAMSRFNIDVSEGLLGGCTAELKRLGCARRRHADRHRAGRAGAAADPADDGAERPLRRAGGARLRHPRRGPTTSRSSPTNRRAASPTCSSTRESRSRMRC